MEDEALYRAILAAPHDDTPRLVYADWLDEHADRLPEIAARTRRTRAEFIRVQCALARFHPAGWKAPGSVRTDPELFWRQKRLLFTQGRKWRRELPSWLASSPFDRGFVRPYRAFRPTEFLVAGESRFGERRFFGVLMPDHPARRYMVGGDYLALAPLWDVHLYASTWEDDPHADRGQYGEVLADIGRSPALERIGWLKVSLFRTSAADFLRTGNFVNVETLVLNCGPFPEVLEAVAENESFRSLRYVRFGTDSWAWGAGMDRFRLASLIVRLDDANRKHLPYGEMRAELRRVLGRAAAESVAPPFTLPVPRIPLPSSAGGGTTRQQDVRAAATGCLAFLGLLAYVLLFTSRREGPPSPDIRLPEIKPIELPDLPKFDWPKKPDGTTDIHRMIKNLEAGRPLGAELPPEEPWWMKPTPKAVPVAPPPRAAGKDE